MSLDIVTETTEIGLTTVATVKTELGITTTSNDARIELLVRRATAWAETFVGYPLLAKRYRETLAGYGTRNLMASRTPVRSIASLFFGTDTGDDATQLLTTEFGLESKPGFLTRTDGWEWSVPVQQDYELRPVPGEEYQPWLIDYVAGFTLDGLSSSSPNWSTEKGTTSTGRSLPYDIESAVIRKTVSVYTGIDGVFSKKVGDLAIIYGVGAQSGVVVDQAAELLKPWRRSA